jgi:hypothetical protein
MMGGEHSKAYVEKIYLANGKDTESVINLFLTGSVPKEQDNKIHVVVEESPNQSTPGGRNQIDLTQQKKK